ncbi:MAG: hypothetical protein RIT28_2220 [Pseudomonadota bacterium]|jgi:hypothetical protein|nr:hypothetical protein [Myxococcota bacterium]
MSSRMMWALAAVMMTGCAAKGKTGTPVTVFVTDTETTAISTAVIRHPDEAERHRVNSVDGSWTEEVLYMPDGSEIVFRPGEMLVLEISAPGYETQVIQYQVRRRKNEFNVQLVRHDFDDEAIEEPMMSFGRDNPRDLGGGGPAN